MIVLPARLFLFLDWARCTNTASSDMREEILVVLTAERDINCTMQVISAASNVDWEI